MSDPLHQGPPVSGHSALTPGAISLLNDHAQMEERLLRHLDRLAARDDVDKRWLAIGRTSIEQGFVAVNRAVARPGRVALPEDQR